MLVGEALVGDGNEIAHIDLIIGSKDGPAGIAFANGWHAKAKATRTCWLFWNPTSP